MKQVVYLDILLALNLIINYFLLFATAKLSGRQLRQLRILLAASMGAAYSMILFIPLRSPLLLGLSKLAMSLGMVRVLNPWEGKRQYLKEFVIFFAVNFLFAGFMLLLCFLLKENSPLFYNGIVYFPVSAGMLITCTALAYIFVELFFRLFRTQPAAGRSYQVAVTYHGREVLLHGTVDTGNLLTDPLSGKPVCVCSYQSVRELLDPELAPLFQGDAGYTGILQKEGRLSQAVSSGKIRFLPYKTVSGAGILPVFEPDRFVMTAEDGTVTTAEWLYIGVSDKKIKADGEILLHPELFQVQTSQAVEAVKS